MLLVPSAWSLGARIAAPLIVLGLLAAAVWGYGVRERRAGLEEGRAEGRAEVRAEWADVKDRQRQVDAAARREDVRAAGEAAAAFEAWRADSQRRQAEDARALRDALQRPVSCPPGAVVGDVLVPAAALDRLRAAGDPGRAAGPAAAGAGR